MAGSNDAVRDEVRAWLADNWDGERPLREWREILADSGWGAPTWPTQFWGRGLTPAAASVVTEEFHKVGAVGAATGLSMNLVAPTILAHANDDVKARFLRGIITGEHKWCQLFSEPGSGSDLAGLTTRADRDGDEWVVNGQKVWNSGAHKAAFGILLARTDWDAPKHKGITYFLIPMDQPGIEVRPLRQMNRHASFNEVFLTDARVPGANVVGELGEGWRATLTTLAHERGVATGRRPRFPKELAGRTVREAQAESSEYYATYSWYPQRAGRPDLIVPQAEATGAVAEPVIRQRIAALKTLEKTAAWSGERTKAARAQGRPPGPEGSLAKLNGSGIARACGLLHTSIAGAHGMLDGPDTAAEGMVAEVLVSTPAMSIAGGTDEIQHNILGERVLGLPKEPSLDSEVPFRDVRTNTGRA
ncbi:MAG: acyl-CoA dehydrogenase family protein [Acidimicrobiales bacterium]